MKTEQGIPPTAGIEERIREFVYQRFPLARTKQIRADDNWLEGGILDSLAILDLVHFLEREFSIQITDEELTSEHFTSLAAVGRFVYGKSYPPGLDPREITHG
jgi:acyl carrier protein